jgi:hypothetical protein
MVQKRVLGEEIMPDTRRHHEGFMDGARAGGWVMPKADTA